MSEVCKDHSRMVEILERVDVRTANIEKTINGNGKMGLATKANLAYEHVINSDKTKNGRLDWLFRTVLGIFILFIAAKVGLK